MRSTSIRTALAAAALALGAAWQLAPAAAAEPVQVTEPLSFSVDPELRPQADVAQVGDERVPVAAVSDAFGNSGDFAADELIVATGDPSQLEGVLARWHGVVLRSLDPGRAGLEGVQPTYLVRIDAGSADTGSLADEVSRLEPDVHGAQRVSSDQGLDVLAAAAEEAVRGLDVGLNWIAYGDTVRTRVTTEAPALGNPFTLPYLCKAGVAGTTAATCAQSTNVAEAWNVLARAGRNPLTASPVPVAIVDGGFTSGDPDWPAVLRQQTSGPNPMTCTGGASCPFHGNNVTSTIVGLVDDRFGTAGVAGRVSAPIIEPAGNMFTVAASLVDAFLSGARVANMSFTGTLPASAAAFTGNFDSVVKAVSTRVALFAAAGNADPGKAPKDIDTVSCFFSACWESEYFWPCETPTVTCVGALGFNSTTEAGFSNFGTGGLSPGDSVDLWSPGVGLQVGLDPSDPGFATNPNATKGFNGTSAASPFAAGVAALILAANPALTTGQVGATLISTAQAAAITPSKSNGAGAVLPDAERAVVAALGGNAPPDIRITAPVSGGSYPRGLVHAVAAASDDQGPPSVVWFVDNVAVAVGPTVDLDTFNLGYGQHTVSARASDGTFSVGDADGGVTITLTNQPPQVAIAQPANGATFSFTQTAMALGKDMICFKGTSSDVNNNPATLQDSQVWWEINGNVWHGHKLYISASQLGGFGTYVVYFHGMDDGSLSAPTVAITITIAQARPTIFGGGTAITLSGC